MRTGIPIYWLLPDPHFGHKMLIERGLRPPDYERKIWSFIDSHVTEKDVILCLGDVIFHTSSIYKDLWRNVPGKKWLVRGNHDKKSASWYIDFGFDCAVDEMSLKVFGKNILFTHEPAGYREDINLNIHAHLHGDNHRGTFVDDGYHISLYLEHEYKMFNLRSVIDKHNQRIEP